MYDDTSELLENEGDAIKWGYVCQMFKNNNFSPDAGDQDELKIFKNIRRSWIFRVVAYATVFPCGETIT
jgi:hypothetical protein